MAPIPGVTEIGSTTHFGMPLTAKPAVRQAARRTGDDLLGPPDTAVQDRRGCGFLRIPEQGHGSLPLNLTTISLITYELTNVGAITALVEAF